MKTYIIRLKNYWHLLSFILILIIIGYNLFSQNLNYRYLSDSHYFDLIFVKGFSLFWILLSVFVVCKYRETKNIHLYMLLLLSIYFVIIYGFLFRGTEYGMNGHWGDNGNRLAEICKMMAYNTFFTDWYLKDLPSFYPPLWFYLMALYAKLIGIEAYQTIKYGYLLIFLVYPWLLYFSWKKITSPIKATAITLGVIFFAHKFLNWVYYEHITASLFVPWWLYYFENCKNKSISLKQNWKFYLLGSVFGALLLMTYYYWFFIAIIATVINLIYLYTKTNKISAIWNYILNKIILTVGIALLSTVYWLPLFKSIYTNGAASFQNIWFGIGHTNLTFHWDDSILSSCLIFMGIFFALYLWNEFGKTKIFIFLISGAIIVLLDRILNLNDTTIQARKILEFTLLFAVIPASYGFIHLWGCIRNRTKLKFGLVGVIGLLAIIFSNQQTEIYHEKYYQTSIDQVVPVNDLAVFKTIDTYDKVFLTNHYLESCYLPYYLFIPLYNMTNHIAGRIDQRESFLNQAIKISEPQILSYILKYNRYSSIDYVYLPINPETGTLKLSINKKSFNKKEELTNYTFTVDHLSAPEIFIEKHERGLYELNPPARSNEFDKIVQEKYPDIYWHLKPLDKS